MASRLHCGHTRLDVHQQSLAFYLFPKRIEESVIHLLLLLLTRLFLVAFEYISFNNYILIYTHPYAHIFTTMSKNKIIFTADKKIKITAQIVEKFAHIVGDMNPVHINDQAAMKTRFGKRIAHGMIGVCFLHNMLPPIYKLTNLDIKFKKPVYLEEIIQLNVNCFHDNNDFLAEICKESKSEGTKKQIVTSVKGKWAEMLS